MKREYISNTLKIVGTFVATTVGAAFASGKEILRFFSIYENWGKAGIVLSGALFFLMCFLVLKDVYRRNAENFNEYLFPVVGKRISDLIEWITLMFLFCVYCVMLAGSGSILMIKAGVNKQLAVILTALICFFIIKYNIDGITKLGQIITPILIIGLVSAGIFIYVTNSSNVSFDLVNVKRVTGSWTRSAILYVGYNIIISIVVLSNMRPFLCDKKMSLVSGVLSGIVLSIMMYSIFMAMNTQFPKILSEDLPMLYLIDIRSKLAGWVYTVLLWFAMLTTAVSASFCFSEKLSRAFHIKYENAALLTCFIAVLPSELGFATLIDYVYPLFGYLGTGLIIIVIISSLKKK